MKHHYQTIAEIEEILAKVGFLVAQGRSINNVCAELGISLQTYDRWNSDRAKQMTDIKENIDLKSELQRLQDLARTLAP